MTRKVSFALLALTVLAVPTAALADYCISWGTAPFVHYLVGRQFRSPPPGQCKPFGGFLQDQTEFVVDNYPVMGNACTAISGSVLSFNLMGTGAAGPTTFSFGISPVTRSGSGQVCVMDTGNGGGCTTVSLAADPGCGKTPYPGP